MQISFHRKLPLGGVGRSAFLFSVAVDALCCILTATQAEGDAHDNQAKMHSRCRWVPALICSMGAGRQCFHYSVLEIYRSFENSVWLLLMLPWKQTAKNGACFFKLSIPSHRFLILLQKLQGTSARPGMTMWLSVYSVGTEGAEITLAIAELQKDRPLVSVGETATEEKPTVASMQAQGSNKLWSRHAHVLAWCKRDQKVRTEVWFFFFLPAFESWGSLCDDFLSLWFQGSRIHIFLALGVMKIQHSCAIENSGGLFWWVLIKL